MPSKHKTRVLGGFSGAAGVVVDGGRGAEGIWGELLNGEIQPAWGVPAVVVEGGCIGGGCSWPGVGSISALEGWGGPSEARTRANQLILRETMRCLE